ncbi:Asp-tRNA(Asn)/Glu-tRNA(Gln) amidotransferase subunit GatB [Legionella septentrionalis]|uniref:Asp-tRNA(Asn)/Glu-tRNA(Gln) amidotransferase subunit GatB n=1 Tax=Legionella septentrionalis TaxID=2498109 RepID=UPI000F8DBDCD|nr:Asp-tRNA(Asn)/Glu-tRNA(Gln) amidotransferase subunit GatB [Legionella septentrionalis]RUQ99540.1 Asp-tRNA(Asn)/Glu-tRNA(Gln) amidotransferase subunit GatB [Legionella septentrionalis]RUR11102.1 Asp-tRNA(Asn)/Glu-tRNA(Gln) amidotransferase subunit GatB [Legionella septentrionalis]
MNWETVIGLEVHVQLKTKSKLFSNASVKYGAAPNSQASFIDAGLPGVLPVLNEEAVRMAIKFGLAIAAEINDSSYFERKNYFYPDLPKGYQISQFQRPIISNGQLGIKTPTGLAKYVHIVRAHLEEDAGKSLHDIHPHYTGIDLNRAGTPLLEIVTAPCLFSAEEAVAYLKTLHQLVRFLGICDGNMQEGSFRCDVNISLRPSGEKNLGTRTELKNLNSFRFIEKAIRYEQWRHQDLLETGQCIKQETRLYSPTTDTTQPMREKESEHDYRYFPDPDLLPIQITEDDLTTVRKNMPPLPHEIRLQMQQEQQLSDGDIEFLLSSPALYNFFSEVKNQSKSPIKSIVNWLKGPYSAALNDAGLTFDNPPVPAAQLALLLDKLQQGLLSAQIAKNVFSKLISGAKDVEAIIALENQGMNTNQAALAELIETIVDNHPLQACDYRAGKEKLLGFFVGLVMRETKGKADPAQVSDLLKTYLSKSN